jgi:uncharacterized protein (TIGR02145 family)
MKRERKAGCLVIHITFVAITLFLDVQCSHKNPASPEYSRMTDIDGNVYRTVRIGSQVWMAENFKVTHYRNGDIIPKITRKVEWENLSTGAYCEYNNLAEAAKVYGYLYNHFAIEDNRNISPAGWHVPTDDDWKILESFLGMPQADLDEIDLRGTDQGGKLKQKGTEHWATPNAGATNSSGFTALPGAYRGSTGHFGVYGCYGHFWTSTEHYLFGHYAWFRGLFFDESKIYREYGGKKAGYAVRLIKD